MSIIKVEFPFKHEKSIACLIILYIMYRKYSCAKMLYLLIIFFLKYLLFIPNFAAVLIVFSTKAPL